MITKNIAQLRCSVLILKLNFDYNFSVDSLFCFFLVVFFFCELLIALRTEETKKCFIMNKREQVHASPKLLQLINRKILAIRRNNRFSIFLL